MVDLLTMHSAPLRLKFILRLRLKVIKLLFYLDSLKLLYECYPLWYSLQWQRHKHMLQSVTSAEDLNVYSVKGKTLTV